DKSDFHFNGRLENYDLWFENKPIGGTQIDFNLTSSLLQLEDLFAYGGENYVPEDYRHEEFRDLKVHGLAKLDFDKKLKSTDVKIDRLEANMNIHSMRFEEFSGDFFIDSTQLKVKDLGGRLGNSQFRADLTYYLNADSTSDSHSFSLNSQKLDFDQLFAYTPPPENVTTKPEDHESGFNLFELPFSNMKFDIDIEQLNYHRYKLGDFVMQGRMQSDHYVYLDTMSLKAAGGDMKLKGYLNGSNPKAIYFSPEVELENIDLDQLLFKFENFGQDHLVSENLHGRLTGTMNGKVHMHADMVPIIDDSELHINFRIVDGSLNDYPAFDALSSYFTDKNLSYIRFDTLENQLDLKNGTLTIPGMNINSTIGYFELSGTQGIDLDMEYYLRVPWKVVTKAGFQKLFKKKNQDNTDQVDEIQYQDENKRARFLNLKIKGTPDDYKISLGKDKK
ncbi:MAG: AsmA-like C-terminal region-containing protein, partial [Bacteroidota bacterium]